MADIVVFGAGQIAEVAKVYIDAHSADRIVAFTVDAAFKKSNTFAGLPLVAWEDLETHYPPDRVQLLGPLSYRRVNLFRRDRHLEGKARGYSFASFIHPDTHIYTRDIGENAFILESNIIQPFAKVGQGAMIWSGNHIGHHAVVGDHCFFSSQIGLSSTAQVGDRCFFGGQVGVNPGVKIGDDCFLGSSARIDKNVPSGSVIIPKGDPPSPYNIERLRRIL